MKLQEIVKRSDDKVTNQLQRQMQMKNEIKKKDSESARSQVQSLLRK